jgi:hypothetical protein
VIRPYYGSHLDPYFFVCPSSSKTRAVFPTTAQIQSDTNVFEVFLNYPFSYNLSGGNLDETGSVPLGVVSLIYYAEYGASSPNYINRISTFKDPSIRFLSVEKGDFVFTSVSNNSNSLRPPLSFNPPSAGWVSQDTLAFVIALNGEWGSGKTTFLRMWRQQLLNSGFQCILFNAWENDFSDSPAVSIMGELGIAAKQKLKETGVEGPVAEEKFRDVLKKAKTIARVLAPKAAGIAGRMLLEKVGVSDDLRKDISAILEEGIENQIDQYPDSKNQLEAFRDSLEAYLRALNQRQPSETASTSEKPLVFIVDELDRCKPTYAIDLLESIKHLFSVKGVVFVLGIDRVQLGSTIGTRYGKAFDESGYLRRFIDFEYTLPKPDPEKFLNELFKRFDFEGLLSKGVHEEIRVNQTNEIQSLLPHLFSLFGFSLRTQEQCVRRLSVVILTANPSRRFFGLHTAFLICLREFDRIMYDRYCSGEIDNAPLFVNIHPSPKYSDFKKKHVAPILEAYLIAGIVDKERRNRALTECENRIHNKTEDPDNNYNQIVWNHISSIRHQFDFSGLTKNVQESIELARAFN